MANNNSIMFDIDDPRSAKVAEALSSKTSRKILNLLSEGEMSGSEIATKLGLPLNTVGYNMKKLVSAGLIDKSKRIFWSSKGKRMELYKLSNKKIIISPKKLNRSLIASVLGVFAILVVALILFSQQPLPDASIGGINSDNLKSFSSVNELKSFIEDNSGSYQGFGFAVTDSVGTTSVARATESSAGGVKAESASDFSETNVQVAGVDEPDIVKNDGKYIYTLTQGKVVIVDAFPASSMNILSEIEVDGARNIFVNGDKLIVMSQSFERVVVNAGEVKVSSVSSIVAEPGYGRYSKVRTVVYIYDISDRNDPELKDEFSFDGTYREARMIDDYVYVISQDFVNLRSFALPTYNVNGVEEEVSASEIYYFDSPDSSYNFNLISAINIDDGDVNTEVYLMGAANNVFVSKDNIYISYMKRFDQRVYLEMYVDEVLYEVLPFDEREEVREIMDSDEDRRDPSVILRNYVNSLEPDEVEEFSRRLQEKLEEFNVKVQKETERTLVHRIEIDGNDIDYEAKGEFPGRVLNQFSMDEYGDYLRVASTTGGWRGDTLNHVYVLDMDLEIVGSVEDLAPGERIFSARFLGKRAYMVTFRQVDPLYVIDLSNPRNPEVLGYLKVTGFSNYLHPYDENHIIGVGKEATGEGRALGVKIALFDVSDVHNPKEVSKYEVKEGLWSNSDALYDHKAFLFDKEKELLVIPISYNKKIDVSNLPSDTQGAPLHRYEFWQGAFVFNINLDDGIELRGKIVHEEDSTNNYYYSSGSYVKRSLFMDDVLYTISQAKIKANDLFTLGEISEVDLGFDKRDVPIFAY